MPTALRAAGFSVIVHDDYFQKRQDVLDPEVIRVCGEKRWFLLTGDSDLTRRCFREIIEASIGVFCQTNNHHGPALWCPRICGLKADIFKLARTQRTPFIAFITAEAKSQLLLKVDWPPFALTRPN